jgi:uncharacterized repeat protein (TIGR01451 family)
MVEFALVVPILLLVFAAAADFGRAFYSYVAIENAAKEGAFFGSRSPICDDLATGCGDPNNVVWHVQNELKNQGIRNPDGSQLVPTIACIDAATGTPRADLDDCTEGDTYRVSVVHQFRLLTPILGQIIGNLNLTSTANAVVLNLAFDPTPGASIQKLVSPTGATNAADIVAKCLEPNDHDSAGFYRNPCLDSSTTDPLDKLKLHFETGTVITYKLTIANSGGQPLSSVTVVDSLGSTGCTFPTSMGVGGSPTPCTYTRTAPTVPGAAITMDYANTATIDSAQTLPATDTITVAVDKPPAELRVLKWVSPFKDGDDGDGNKSGTPTFGTLDDVTVTYSSQIANPSAWFKVIVQNTGGQPATGLQITDDHGSLPFGQNNANAICDANISSLAAGGRWECRYKVNLSSGSPASTDNTAEATATNVTADSNDTATATVHVSQCQGSNRTVPNLIGLNKAGANAAWTAAGLTGTLTTWNGQNNATVVAQSRPAFDCVAATSTMTVSRTNTP